MNLGRASTIREESHGGHGVSALVVVATLYFFLYSAIYRWRGEELSCQGATIMLVLAKEQLCPTTNKVRQGSDRSFAGIHVTRLPLCFLNIPPPWGTQLSAKAALVQLSPLWCCRLQGTSLVLRQGSWNVSSLTSPSRCITPLSAQALFSLIVICLLWKRFLITRAPWPNHQWVTTVDLSSITY